jgi:hypothetical protein
MLSVILTIINIMLLLVIIVIVARNYETVKYKKLQIVLIAMEAILIVTAIMLMI